MEFIFIYCSVFSPFECMHSIYFLLCSLLSENRFLFSSIYNIVAFASFGHATSQKWHSGILLTFSHPKSSPWPLLDLYAFLLSFLFYSFVCLTKYSGFSQALFLAGGRSVNKSVCSLHLPDSFIQLMLR